MDSTAILLHSTRGDSWHHDTELTNLSNTELESLAQKARNTLQLLEAELQKRHGTTLGTPHNLVDDWEKRFQSCLQHIQTHGRLDKRTANCVELAVRILSAEQTGRREIDYQDFLNDILRQCGPGPTLLCAAGFGKYNIAGMNKQNRMSLVNYVRSKQASFDCPELASMVTQYKMPLSIGTKSSGTLQDQTYVAGQLQIEDTRSQQASMEQTSPPTPKFIFSKAPISQIPLLGEPLLSAVQSSHTWSMERNYGIPTTDCLAVEMSKNLASDVTITIHAGAELGYNMINMFMLEASQ